MDINTLSNVVVAWCAALTLIGGTLSLVFRHWMRSYVSRYNEALHNAEMSLKDAHSEITALKGRYVVVKVYAKKLYDLMVLQGIKPETPPNEFYQD